MAVCRATKANGDPCRAPATGPRGYCWAHDPAHAEERSRMASKAARSKPNRELSTIKALLEDLTNRVLSDDLETGRAAVANQLINTRLRAIEQERKMRETEELEERLEALEEALEQQTMHPTKGARRW
jgi:hypothetical protein